MTGIIIGILGFLAAAVALVFGGKSMQKTKQAKEELKDYADTRENIEEAQSDAADVDSAEWLRKRKSDRDL